MHASPELDWVCSTARDAVLKLASVTPSSPDQPLARRSWDYPTGTATQMVQPQKNKPCSSPSCLPLLQVTVVEAIFDIYRGWQGPHLWTRATKSPILTLSFLSFQSEDELVDEQQRSFWSFLKEILEEKNLTLRTVQYVIANTFNELLSELKICDITTSQGYHNFQDFFLITHSNIPSENWKMIPV